MSPAAISPLLAYLTRTRRSRLAWAVVHGESLSRSRL